MKAKMKLKRLLSFLLALLMVVGMLPATSLTAHAEGETLINEVSLAYDASKFSLDTQYTEGEVKKALLNTLSSTTTGISIDKDNSSLVYFVAGAPYGVGDGTNQIQEGRTYYVEYCLKVASDEGYDWAAKDSGTTAITYYLNGVKTTPVEIKYNEYWNLYKVYFELGTASSTAAVASVSITPTDVSVQAGNSTGFTATVAGTATDKSVTWSVSGATSSDTKISDAGVLTVGSDESAKKITVKAVSNSEEGYLVEII